MVSRANSFQFYYQLVSPVAEMLCFCLYAVLITGILKMFCAFGNILR
jgi:hypothetical protein